MDSKLKCVFALPAGQELNNVEEKLEPGYDQARSQVAPTPAQSEVKVSEGVRQENIAGCWTRTLHLFCFSSYTQLYSMKVIIISYNYQIRI